MTTLAELCRGLVPFPEPAGSTRISDLVFDSRKAAPGALFAAVAGTQRDGRKYVEDAVRRGAAAVLAEGPIEGCPVPVLFTDSVRRTLSRLAARFFGDPSSSLMVAGVTGTNGKTTITYLLESVFLAAGFEPGVIGTISYRWKGHEETAGRTTPESVDLQRMLRDMRSAGTCAVAMEVSSHALALDRALEIGFQAAVFTNLTHDHLDFHGTLEAYGEAKSRLFGQLRPDGVAIVNADDPASDRVTARWKGRKASVGFDAPAADYRILDVRLDGPHTRFILDRAGRKTEWHTALWGRFNAFNAAIAAVTGLELGLEFGAVREGILRMARVPGRMEGFVSKRGVRVVVDYAHTPDALDNVLAALRGFTAGRVIAVFGCGGDRDRAKRPEMGRIAASGSDRVFVTSDNPRTEDPDAILTDILAGIADPSNVTAVPDREEAIRSALDAAAAGDTVLLAGKGHEEVQEILGIRRPFNDRRTAEAHLKERGDL
jgi:UDP-N-acetylmuramoyl-L-alanyl-D-glutamate--2,6-diaminopimelate ligase